jgi:hypothetical protein
MEHIARHTFEVFTLEALREKPKILRTSFGVDR